MSRTVFSRPIVLALVVLLVLSSLLGSMTFTPVRSVLAVGPSGQAMPVGNLPGWTQTFADDFTTNYAEGSVSDPGIVGWPYAYNNPDTAGRDTAGSSAPTGSYWTPSVISVNNGVLDYHLHKDASGHNMSGAVGRSASQIYGRYAVRMRADAIEGYKTAFLLFPDSDMWPRDGEIDFPEGDLIDTVGGATHYQGGTSGGDQDPFSTTTTYPGWHTYVIEWAPATLKYYIDGTLVWTTSQRIPNTKMHWVLQSETCLGSTDPTPSPTCHPSNVSDGHVQIDWATEYSYTPNNNVTPTATAVATATGIPPTFTPTATLTPVPTATSLPATSTPIPGTATPTPTVIASTSTPTPIPGDTTIRINAGATANYTDGSGNVWLSDRYFTGGTADTNVNTTIANNTAAGTNTAPTIYKSERWGASSYDIPVKNGTYNISMKFMECCFGGSNSRLFNVTLQGATVLSAFDVYAQSGGANRALDKTFPATVTDGFVHLRFVTGTADQPQINGIVVSSTGVNPTATPVPATPTPLPPTATAIPPTATATSVPPTATNVPPTATLVPPTATSTGTRPSIRINAGSSTNYVDGNGNTWLSDRYYSTTSGSNADTLSPPYPVVNANGKDGLYTSERWGSAVQYLIPVPTGNYYLTLKFVECCFNGPNQRKFNVFINNMSIYNYDVYAVAGGQWTATDIAATVAPNSAGNISITLNGITGYDYPEIVGISVVPAP